MDDRLPERLRRQIVHDSSTDCWLWMGSLNRNGYGRTTRTNSRTSVVAHRYVYELVIGPIPDGLQLDHLCRVRNCVNPEHVEPVTQRTNLLRGETITARSAAVTHCPSGHPYSGRNLRVSREGYRYCRECRRIQESLRRERLGDVYRERQRAYDAAYRARKKPAAA